MIFIAQIEIPESGQLNLLAIFKCLPDLLEEHLDQLFGFKSYSSIVLISDKTVKELYGKGVKRTLEMTDKEIFEFTLPVGEREKSLSAVERIYGFLVKNGLDRRTLICTLGGGVVGDLGGYVAATYLRGVDYIQLPTTLLAQVDSSIGGKVGVNFAGKKNMVGSFYQPKAIICDIACLKSLPAAQMRSGMAEVVKYGIAMDEELFNMLDQSWDGRFNTAELMNVISRCGVLKASVVEADETERSGERAILNFGHTVGHAIEAVTGLRRLSHGEAVAIGMMAAALISKRTNLIKADDVQRIEQLLIKFELPVSCRGVKLKDLLKTIRFDKKTTLGRTGWVLLEGIGKGVVNQLVAEHVVKEVLAEMCR